MKTLGSPARGAGWTRSVRTEGFSRSRDDPSGFAASAETTSPFRGGNYSIPTAHSTARVTAAPRRNAASGRRLMRSMPGRASSV